MDEFNSNFDFKFHNFLLFMLFRFYINFPRLLVPMETLSVNVSLSGSNDIHKRCFGPYMHIILADHIIYPNSCSWNKGWKIIFIL